MRVAAEALALMTMTAGAAAAAAGKGVMTVRRTRTRTEAKTGARETGMKDGVVGIRALGRGTGTARVAASPLGGTGAESALSEIAAAAARLTAVAAGGQGLR